MTKLHAEFIRGSVSEILETLEAKPEIKGECTLLVGGCQKEKAVGRAVVKAEITSALEKQKGGLSDIAKTIAQKYGLSKKEVYEMALAVRGQKTEGRGQ